METPTALVVDAFFEQRGTEALHHPTPDLLVDQLRIDDRAAILDDPVLQQLDEAGIGIDLEPRRLNAVGKGKRIFARDKMAGRHQFGLNARRQRVRTKINDTREFVQFDARHTVAGIHDNIVDDIKFTGRRLQDGGGNVENIPAQHLCGLKRRLAADAGAARGPGAAAIGRVVGIAENNADTLHRNAKDAADNLRRERFGSLPLLGNAGLADHRTLGVQPHGNTVLR